MNKLPKTVYHGTTSNYLQSLQNGINLNKCARKSDFGRGFYTTSDFKQALKWSNKRANNFNEFRTHNKVEGIVLTLDINTYIFDQLNGLIFENTGYRWTKFVHRNRSQAIKFRHGYDFVYGNVADGSIDALIDLKDSGKISYNKMMKLMRHKYSSDQLSFHTWDSIKCLNIREEVNYYEDCKQELINKGV
jgi:hypothetical protein